MFAREGINDGRMMGAVGKWVADKQEEDLEASAGIVSEEKRIHQTALAIRRKARIARVICTKREVHGE